MQLQVIVNKLNRRRSPATDFFDKSNIKDVVTKGFIFESVTETSNLLGKWYIDKDENYYWEGGVESSIEKNIISSFDSNQKKDWWFSVYKIDDLWKLSRGKNIKVAILDSGLHSDLSEFKDNNNISFYNAFTESSQSTDCLDDTSNHGTECASILCSQGKTVYGVAPDVSLLVIKISDNLGQRKSSAIIKGLSKAIALKCDIISMSFTFPEADENFKRIHDLIKEAYNENILVVASAGDSGDLPFPVDEYPATFPECLSIGAINKKRIRSSVSTMSNFLDLMAPGDELFSLTNSGQTIRGTSYSTPFFAGLMAITKSILKSNNIHVSNIKLFDVLKRSADKNIVGYNVLEHGWGIVDPVAALKLLNIKS